MPAPICVQCRIEMRCVLNGQLVHDPRIGAFAETWWIGDKFGCPNCEREIVLVNPRSERIDGRDFFAGLGNDTAAAVPFVYNLSDRHLLDQYTAEEFSG